MKFRRIALRKKSHCVYAIFFHLVIVTKYRHGFLKEPAARRILWEVAKKSAEETEIIIKEVAMEKDHAHFLLEATPQTKVTTFIKLLKGRSSFLIRKALPALAKHRAFWSPSFCLLSTGGAPIDIIRKYIEKQGIRDTED